MHMSGRQCKKSDVRFLLNDGAHHIETGIRSVERQKPDHISKAGIP